MTDQVSAAPSATESETPDIPGIPGKPTSASRTTLSHIMSHNDTNLLGTVHGGVIMKLVDDAAGPPSPPPWTRWPFWSRSASATSSM